MQIVTLILRCRAIVFLYELELMTSLLCEMLQNRNDDRYVEARRQLLEVESRLNLEK